MQRPFLTARWTELLILNFTVPTDVIAELAPPGTEPDCFNNESYVSIVGFHFRDTRLRGIAWPRHTNFLEINLRYYVRRNVDGETRRGVVFVREIVPRQMIALIANYIYHENYVCRPMRSRVQLSEPCLAAGDQLEYGWQSQAGLGRRWNTLAARVAAPLGLPAANSFEEFIVDHYWGFVHGRDRRTREYRISHDPWRVGPADQVHWDCDIGSTYSMPLANYLISPPVNALIADGAAVEVFPGHAI